MANLVNNVTKLNEGTTIVKNEGAAIQEVVLNRSDNKVSFLLENTDSTNDVKVTFVAGDGTSAVQGDLEVEVAATEFAAVGQLDSARFKESGKVIITILDPDGETFTGDTTDVLITVFESPKGLVD